MRVLLRPEARADALDAFHWYEERAPGLGAEFRLALDQTIQRIPEHPKVYPAHHRHLRHALV